MSIEHDSQILNKSRKYLLYLKADSNAIIIEKYPITTTLKKISALASKQVKNLLIIDVKLNGINYTLKCKKNKVYKMDPFTIISEIEKEANTLISVNKNIEINDLFVKIHGHGRLWGISGSDNEDESWEVLLLNKLQFIESPKKIENYLPFMALAFSRLAHLHEKQYVYGHPTLDYLAKKSEYLTAQSLDNHLVWIECKTVQEVTTRQPLVINLLKMKDITTLLLDNDFVFNQLKIKDFNQLDLDIFKSYQLQLIGDNVTLPQIIMPRGIFNIEINDISVRDVVPLVLPNLNYWMDKRFKEIACFEEYLSDESKLQALIQDLISFYNKTKFPQQITPVPPTPIQPARPPLPETIPVVTPPPPPTLSPPPVLRYLYAEYNRPYLLEINQTFLAPPGNTGAYYKYKRLPNDFIAIGIGSLNSQDFVTFNVAPQSPYYTNRIVTLTFTPGTQPIQAQIAFHFITTQPYIMRVTAGNHLYKSFDLRYTPPLEIQ